jgi:hypothetical protein
MLENDLKVADGAAAGAWIKPRLGGEFGAVTLQVPKGYEAYARIFHPASDPEGNPVSWAEVADALGTTAHREMQWHALVGLPEPEGFADSKWPGGDPSIGSMDPATLDALCEVLAAHTADPKRCFFGLCTIQTWEDSFSADELKHPYLKLPWGRDQIVLAGPLSAVDQIVFDWSKPSPSRARFVAWTGEGPPPEPDPAGLRSREAPNLIWPADHSWLVASEVDFDSTLVGGNATLIEAIVKSPELEAWQVEPTDSLAAGADGSIWSRTATPRDGNPL